MKIELPSGYVFEGTIDEYKKLKNILMGDYYEKMD